MCATVSVSIHITNTIAAIGKSKRYRLFLIGWNIGQLARSAASSIHSIGVASALGFPVYPYGPRRGMREDSSYKNKGGGGKTHFEKIKRLSEDTL